MLPQNRYNYKGYLHFPQDPPKNDFCTNAFPYIRQKRRLIVMKHSGKNRLTALMGLICLLTLLIGIAVPVYAADGDAPIQDYVILEEGTYCLHPHRLTPTDASHILMTATPSTEYTGRPQEVMDIVAAAVVLRYDYYRETGVVVNHDNLQQLIWKVVCDEPECIQYNRHFPKENDKVTPMYPVAEDYYAYVMDHYLEVVGRYTMTIWVSSDPDYQDLLEAKLVEKHTVPGVEKKVLDKNDSVDPANSYDSVGWQDSADHDIGDSIPFRITASLREIASFKKYYVEFVDNMTHLTPDFDTLTITIDGTDVTDKLNAEDGFILRWDPDTKEMKLFCMDVKALGATDNSKIVVNYNATLDADANIGYLGNPNEVYLIYSRSSNLADRGQTANDKVTVFTFRILVNKVDPDDNPLPGAAFELFKKMADGTYQSLGVRGATKKADGSYTMDSGNPTTFMWEGIDDGVYKIVEVVTPVGYNTAEPFEYTVTAQHQAKAEDPQLYLYEVYEFELDGEKHVEEYLFYGSEWGDYVCHFETNVVNAPGRILPSTGGMGTTPIYLTAALLILTSAALLLKKRRA